MLTPYQCKAPELNSQAAILSLTYHQLQTVANAIWAFYALIDKGADLKTLLPEAREWAAQNEKTVQSAHDAFVNCTMALELSHHALLSASVFSDTPEGLQ